MIKEWLNKCQTHSLRRTDMRNTELWLTPNLTLLASLTKMSSPKGLKRLEIPSPIPPQKNCSNSSEMNSIFFLGCNSSSEQIGPSRGQSDQLDNSRRHKLTERSHNCQVKAMLRSYMCSHVCHKYVARKKS